MTVEEVFKKLSSHMVKGVMIHDQLADYYDFLNLHGYKRCHEYHAKCEMHMYRKLHRYFINHYNKLIEEEIIDNPDVIPSSWYRYNRKEVDVNTKKSAVKSGIERWVSWEEETKSLYESIYTELLSIGDISASKFLCCLIEMVDKELKHANRKHIDLNTVDYNINYILGEQSKLHDHYKDKMKHYGKHRHH